MADDETDPRIISEKKEAHAATLDDTVSPDSYAHNAIRTSITSAENATLSIAKQEAVTPVQDVENQEQPSAEEAEEDYSIFTKGQKRAIIAFASSAAFFSPLSSNIYLPAITQIADDLNVSYSEINLTITTYLIMQGISPAFIAGFSDTAGRRPAYIICFTIYLAANIGLATQNSYAALMVLRAVQSAGSSGTVALASGVAADIVTSAERGTYMAFAAIGSVFGPALSPILGGVLAQYAGWRWIFWFLTILTAVFFVPLLLFMPETCRNVVGNGAYKPPNVLCRSITGERMLRKLRKTDREVNREKQAALEERYRVRFPNPLGSVKVILDKECGFILFSNGLVIACLYCILAGIPSQYKAIYGFNELEVSLVFLGWAAGSLLCAVTIGKLIDRGYARHARKHGLPITKNKSTDLSNFPIERARLEIALPMMYIGSAAQITYGWVLNFETNLSGPIIMLVFMGYSNTAGYQTMNTLLVDVNPGKPATAAAASNLVRCLLGAVATAVLNPMFEALGRGWTYTLMAMLWVVYSPVMLCIIKYGPMWRRSKKEKQQQHQQQQQAPDASKI